jgi:hypothetical protein
MRCKMHKKFPSVTFYQEINVSQDALCVPNYTQYTNPKQERTHVNLLWIQCSCDYLRAVHRMEMSTLKQTFDFKKPIAFTEEPFSWKTLTSLL